MSEQQASRDWIRGVAKQLTKGEQVIVLADKERKLTVSEEAEHLEREPYRCNGYRITLEGYGTEYEIEIPDEEYDSGSHPRLLYPSSSATGYPVEDLTPVDGDGIIVAQQTAADLGIPER